jgi:hypothetical protein
MIEAITGQGFGLNVLTEMICGFVLPGYPGTKNGIRRYLPRSTLLTR